MPDTPSRTSSSWFAFAIATISGLCIALLFLAIQAMGECLPRDQSVKMFACDINKRDEIWLYIVLVLETIGVALWRQSRRLPYSWFLTLSSPFIAGISTLVISIVLF